MSEPWLPFFSLFLDVCSLNFKHPKGVCDSKGCLKFRLRYSDQMKTLCLVFDILEFSFNGY